MNCLRNMPPLKMPSLLIDQDMLGKTIVAMFYAQSLLYAFQFA